MQTQLEKEAEEDEEIYDNLACWCETNDKVKIWKKKLQRIKRHWIKQQRFVRSNSQNSMER